MRAGWYIVSRFPAELDDQFPLGPTPQAKLQVPSNNAPRSGTTPLASPMFDLFRGANPVAYFARLGLAFPTDVLRATAARMSALNAPVSTSSPSWMSIARLVFPSRLELKSLVGSFKEAPLAKVNFTIDL